MARMIKFIFSSRHTKTIDPHNRHKKKVPDVVRDLIRISDIVLEVLDARFIDETRNKEMEGLIQSHEKKIVFVLNKADLVDINELKKEADKKGIYPYVIVSCKDDIGKGKLIERIKIESKRELKKKNYEIAHVGVIGYPNAGKSSLINLLTGRSAAKTSAEAGYTKGMQKIRLAKGLLLLDTPGVIPLDENSSAKKEDLIKHAKINVRTYDKIKNPEFVVFGLIKENPEKFEKFYNIDSEDAEMFIEELGKRKNWIVKGGKVNNDKTARMILKDWQEGKIR